MMLIVGGRSQGPPPTTGPNQRRHVSDDDLLAGELVERGALQIATTIDGTPLSPKPPATLRASGRDADSIMSRSSESDMVEPWASRGSS